MAVLVTGGAGYIGAHILLELLAGGQSAVVLDDLSTGFRENIPAGAEFVHGSTGDAALLDTLLSGGRIDAVIHMAASLIVPESVALPQKYFRNNVANASVLFEACARHGVRRIVFSSTAAVYGEAGGRVRESDVLAPLSPYGRSKLAAEWLLEDLARANSLTAAALRYFNVAGADPQGRAGYRQERATHLVQVACEAALGLRPYLEVFGDDWPTADGTGVRDYIHVSDLARAHVALLQALKTAASPYQAYNCGYGRGYSVLEVAAAVERVVGKPLPVRRVPRRPGDIGEVVADVGKIRDALDWAPRHQSLDEIVNDTLRWERARRGLA